MNRSLKIILSVSAILSYFILIFIHQDIKYGDWILVFCNIGFVAFLLFNQIRKRNFKSPPNFGEYPQNEIEISYLFIFNAITLILISKGNPDIVILVLGFCMLIWEFGSYFIQKIKPFHRIILTQEHLIFVHSSTRIETQ